MRDSQQVQLFLTNGQLVATVTVDMIDGRWPLVTNYGGFTYVLQHGRYVRANMQGDGAIGVAR